MTGGARVDVLHLLWSGGIGGIERMVEAFVESAPRDVGTAAAAVARLLGDAAARDELRRRGERVAMETTTEAVLERLQAVYQPVAK